MEEEFRYSIHGKEIVLNRPEPISKQVEFLRFTKRVDPEEALETLLDGKFVLIHDFFSTGLAFLNVLKQYVNSLEADQSFKGQRDFRKMYREWSQRILLRIVKSKLTARKSPEIGWLEKFYPTDEEFLLPFPQVQGLNSSWQWHEKGLKIPGLRDKIHPFYGVYFPTRFDHMLLFDTWLKTYIGNKEFAIDVGIGSGILSYFFLKYKFKRVLGIDSNPNAIIGQLEWQKKNKLASSIELFYGDLFGDCKEKADVIVFNPPWLPAIQNVEGLDTAIYYDENLFPRFFEEAKKHLKPNGRLILLFSNLAQITNITSDHPIEKELADENRFHKEKMIQKDVAQASKKTKRNLTRRSAEKVELWILKNIES